MVRKILFIFLMGVAGVIFAVSVSPSRVTTGFDNERCYVLLKSWYKSDIGMESLDAVITFSFLKESGTITANAVLTTTDNKTIPLLQRMNFTFSPPKNDEYTLKVVSVMNPSLDDSLPQEMSQYMRNVLNVHLVTPEGIKFRILPEKEGNYIIYNNIIPWVFCNGE
jgi:hypothetical protein